ncbi:calcium/sodium antiporter [Demequina capsici]|uniref:Calcium/sodium antiporter n=1 Tax=Demequina capsici TaxID=3075620 RepID=A0AA96FEN4_9MICO|nr:MULTISPECIES: calcium/sodium antiporter [unclassified Demequina]WNM25216.1 calcium/sodium antiporter [Demequina sp. OYTSA14]WNM28129.1 calcium/sodium antiporter [Demequina sp. PMTSA13]
MLIAAVATLVGLAALAWSADHFVNGASAVARRLGMAPLLVGMLIIGFGTSAPELVVSAFAASDGAPELAIGNAFGSNVANIGLILGITAMVVPIAVHRGVLRRELPALIVVTVIVWLLLADGTLSRLDAAVLGAALVAQIGWAVVVGGRHADDELAREVESEPPLGAARAWTSLIAGLVLLVLSSRLLVWGAVGIAERLGWSDLVIGLTVVAIGTSAPELASALAAVRKGENDMALGNVIGSNLFNTLGVLAVAGLIAPADVDPHILTRDLPVVLGLTVLLVVFALWPWNRGRISRTEGGILLTLWLGYTAFLLVTA